MALRSNPLCNLEAGSFLLRLKPPRVKKGGGGGGGFPSCQEFGSAMQKGGGKIWAKREVGVDMGGRRKVSEPNFQENICLAFFYLLLFQSSPKHTPKDVLKENCKMFFFLQA